MIMFKIWPVKEFQDPDNEQFQFILQNNPFEKHQ